MAKGRPPKPVETRKREGGSKRKGTVSHRPVPTTTTVARIEPDGPAPKPPRDLPDEGKPIWVELVALLQEAGLLDEVDLAAIRVAIVQYVQHDLALRVVSEQPDETELDQLIANRENSLAQTAALLVAKRARLARKLRDDATAEDVSVSEVGALITAEERLGKATERLANLREYRRVRNVAGGLVALGSTGQLVEHPLAGTQRAAAALFLRFASEFGATTLARTRISLGKAATRRLDRDVEAALGKGRKRKAS